MPRIPSLPFKSLLAHLSSARPTPALLKDVPAVPALSQWFNSAGGVNVGHFSGLEDPLVPLEHTSPSNGTFDRLEVPLSFYLQYLSSPPPSNGDTLYLAQFPPPASLASAVPPPPTIASLFSHSSLWLGITPTTTPLHRDPDDNLLYQLAGSKRIRLLAPNEGQALLDGVREETGGRAGRMRGDEMMRPGPGGERDALEKAVWEAPSGSLEEGGWMWEGQLERGDALFIPRGWWHAVRGRARWDAAEEPAEHGQEKLNASVNWWFRG